MALSKDDLRAVRSIVQDETRDFVRKADLAPFATKADLVQFATKEDLRETVRSLVNKADLKEALSETEDRLTKKIELEGEKTARLVANESVRLRKRDDELARHVGYSFGPEADERSS